MCSFITTDTVSEWREHQSNCSLSQSVAFWVICSLIKCLVGPAAVPEGCCNIIYCQRGNKLMASENEILASPDVFTAEIDQGENLSNSQESQPSQAMSSERMK